MIRLYGTPRSGNTRKVRMALTVLGLPWEEHLATRRWLVGDRLTIADLAASPHLALAGEAGVDLAASPAIVQWTDRIASRPDFPTMPGWPAHPAS